VKTLGPSDAARRREQRLPRTGEERDCVFDADRAVRGLAALDGEAEPIRTQAQEVLQNLGGGARFESRDLLHSARAGVVEVDVVVGEGHPVRRITGHRPAAPPSSASAGT
jgi:hypothetical protein